MAHASTPAHSGLLTKSMVQKSLDADHDSVVHAETENSDREVLVSQDEVMLTTLDNPYNPFTEFDEWFAFDENEGYHSSALLARITVTSDDISESEQVSDYEDAINEIVRENVSGVHRKVFRKDLVD